MRTASITVLETTRPIPGTTKFDPGMEQETASQIAHWFYDSIQDIHQNPDIPVFDVTAYNSYVACVGIHGGKPAILHKTPDGGRELQILQLEECAMPSQHPSVEEFQGWTREHPLANIPGFQVLVIHGTSGLLLLSLHVPVPYREQGHGRAILNKLIEIADQHQVPILLETSEQSESFAWIQNWYIRHGFEYTGQVGDYGPYMRRDPAQAEPEKKQPKIETGSASR